MKNYKTYFFVAVAVLAVVLVWHFFMSKPCTCKEEVTVTEPVK